jgi:ribosomal protein S18 acetylase RimI-like enzyme
MAKVPIKHSLEKIWVLACAVSKQQVLEMVEKHGFTNIKEIDSYY